MVTIISYYVSGDLRLVLSAPGVDSVSLPVYPVCRDGAVEGVAPQDVKTTIPTLRLKTMTETKAVEAGELIDEWINKFVGKTGNNEKHKSFTNRPLKGQRHRNRQR